MSLTERIASSFPGITYSIPSGFPLVSTKKDAKDETVDVVKEENVEETKATETVDDDKKGE